ncbi:hypothetical protein [Bacillus infantis]|uniref:hypothetical protein n=1 Tax=Bacillus infantis TaxID=324767 RepID=UPI003CF2CA9B
MREVDRSVKNFFDSNAMYLLFSNILWAVFMSLIPYGIWNMKLFITFMIVTVIEVSIAWIWWKKPGIGIVRYNSLTAYTQFLTMSVFISFPIYRMTWGYTWFAVFLGIFVLVWILSMYKRESLFLAFTSPKGVKTLIPILMVLGIFFILGGLSSYRGQEMVLMASLTDYGKAWYISLFCYGLGLFIMFITAPLLKKVE